MDRTRRRSVGVLRELVRRSPLGFHSKSIRFEGGGRHEIGRLVLGMDSNFPCAHQVTCSFFVGLKRTGKSCRLRWVNYLHPGLKRGKMTPHEERLVLQLHTKWGNRWSKIARKIPGRTDNEIKNYWRTHMRKKAQEKKKGGSINNIINHQSSSSSTTSSSSSTTTGGNGMDFTVAPAVDETSKVYSMDEIWKDIELSEASSCSNFTSSLPINSPVWAHDHSIWSLDDHNIINSLPFNNNFSFI